MAMATTLLYNVLWVITFAIINVHTLQCGDGLVGETPGITIPTGDIFLRNGTDLKIMCWVNLTRARGLNSSHLFFKIGDKVISQEYTKILNESTIELHVVRPQPSNDMYTCSLKGPSDNVETPVCLNYVVIGTPPQKPDDFHCVSQNWDNLTCAFHPKMNYVKTDYKISFYVFNPGQNNHSRPLNNCTNMTIDILNDVISCFWDLDTPVQYRQQYSTYIFNIKMSNQFGEENFTYNFPHFENVIPARPSYLDVQTKTAHSAVLVWNITRPMNTFKVGLNHRVQYISEHENTTWKVADTRSIPIKSKLQYRFQLSSLKYAYTRYDVRVQVKSAVAPDEEQKWSKYRAMTFRTLPERPTRPPRTVIGSFEIVDKADKRDILLYWQTIEEYEKNGPDFKYIVNISEDGNPVLNSSNRISNNYAIFSDLKFDREYEFAIESANSMGRSADSSLIHVPMKNRIVEEPQKFTKISLSDYVYELSWSKPPDGAAITNYTVFWCQSGRERPAICPNSIEWHTVPATNTSHIVTVKTNKNYQFAISANTRTSSSGMIWATCTVLQSGVGKMKTVRIESVSNTSMTVSWVLECTERIGAEIGFRIYYCTMPSPYASGCQGPRMDRNFTNNPIQNWGTITGLQPYTTYQVNVSVITKNKEGLASDPLYNTTLEAAPTPPQSARILNITNTTATLTWDPPEYFNGVLRFYDVTYRSQFRNQTIIVEKDQNCQVTLTGLYGYTNYTFMVRACTSSCSEPSNIIKARTLISCPSNVTMPHLTNQSALSWGRPYYPGGNIDYYEILFTQTRDGKTTKTLHNTTGNEFIVPDAICVRDSLTAFSFTVRAVNIIKRPREKDIVGDALQTDLILPGDWSRPIENVCYRAKANYDPFIWAGGIVGGLFFVALISYLCKRLYNYYESMRDIEVKLPPGISSSIEKEPRFPFDETSLLPQKNRKLSISDERNTINSSFTSKNTFNDSGVHDRSDDHILSGKWSNPNCDDINLLNSGGKSVKITNTSTDEWPSDKGDGYTKLTDNSASKYCLVGADQSSKNNSGKSANGYVQAVMPTQDHESHKPYESFECTILKPLVNKAPLNEESAMNYSPLTTTTGEKVNGYLPINSFLPNEEGSNSILLSPQTPEDNQDDDNLMEQIKTGVKRSEASPGYVVVDASDIGPNKFHTPLLPVNVSNLQNSMIPKGYVKAAEVPPVTSIENNIIQHPNNGHVQVHSPYVSHGDLNKRLNPNVTKKLINPAVNAEGSTPSPYVQYKLDNI